MKRFLVAPAIRHVIYEPTTKPIRNVLARRGKKRQLAKLNADLHRLQCYVHGEPKRIERADVIEVAVETDLILSKIVETGDLIEVMYGRKCTHLLLGPDFHRSLRNCPELQMQATIRIQDCGLQRIFGFTIVVIPWMQGFLPITNPAQWPSPL